MECKTGHLFELYFNRSQLLDFFRHPSSDIQIRILHIAIVHMQDLEMVDQIMVNFCSQDSYQPSRSLIKEYLIGSSYSCFRNSLSSSMLFSAATNTTLLQCIPNTTIPFQSSIKLDGFSYSYLHGVPWIVTPSSPLQLLSVRDRDSRDAKGVRSSRIQLENLHARSFSHQLSRRSSLAQMRNFFKFFSMDDVLTNDDSCDEPTQEKVTPGNRLIGR